MVLCLFYILALLLCSNETFASGSRERSALCLAWDQNAAFHLRIHLPFNPSCSVFGHSLFVSSVVVGSAPPAIPIMPRVRSRMSCRRGSSRGNVSCQPSSMTSEPLSNASNFSFSRYPVTRSGRRRGRGQIITEACSYQSQSHTARFRFPCSLGNSTFIASVTVELSEDIVGPGAEGSGAVGPEAPMETKTADKNEATQRKDPGGPVNQETNTCAGPSAPTEGDSSGNEGQPFDPEDPDHFGCRIIEESPPTSPGE